MNYLTLTLATLPLLFLLSACDRAPKANGTTNAATNSRIEAQPVLGQSPSAKDNDLDGTYSAIDNSGDVLRISRGNDGQFQVSGKTAAGTWERPQTLRVMPKESDFLKEREFASAVEAGYLTSDGGGAFFVMKQGASLFGEKVPARYMWFPYVYLKKR